MSDRLAVMSNGRIEQVGPPREVYEEPSTAYVADFLGVSNLMDAIAYGPTEGGCKVRFGEFELVAGEGEPDAHGEVKLSIRPERVDLEASDITGPNRIPGMVERLVYVGSTMQVIVNLAPGEKLQALIPNEGEAHPVRAGHCGLRAPAAGGAPRAAAGGSVRGRILGRGSDPSLSSLRSRTARSPRRPSGRFPAAC